MSDVMLALLTVMRSAMTAPVSGSSAPSRIASACNALVERSGDLARRSLDLGVERGRRPHQIGRDVGVGEYFRVDNNMVGEHWGVMDTGALMQQLTGA